MPGDIRGRPLPGDIDVPGQVEVKPVGQAEVGRYYVSNPEALRLEFTKEQWAYVKQYPGIEFSFLRLNGNVLEWTTEMTFQSGSTAFTPCWNAGVPCEYQLYVARLRRSGLVKCIYSRSAERPRGSDPPATGGALYGDLLPGWRELQEQATTAGAAHDTDTTELLGDAPHAVHPADWRRATEEVHHRQAHWRRVWKAALLLWLSIQPDGKEAAGRFAAAGMPCVDVVVGNTEEIFPSQPTLAAAVAKALKGGRDEVPAARQFDFQVLKDPNWPLILKEARSRTTIEAEKLFYSVLLSSKPAQRENLARLGAAAITFPPPAGAPAAEDEEDEELPLGPFSRSMQLPAGEASVAKVLFTATPAGPSAFVEQPAQAVSPWDYTQPPPSLFKELSLSPCSRSMLPEATVATVLFTATPGGLSAVVEQPTQAVAFTEQLLKELYPNEPENLFDMDVDEPMADVDAFSAFY